jgi:protein MpaA
MEKRHSVHDYQALIHRWKTLLICGMFNFDEICTLDHFPVYEARNYCQRKERLPSLYISAGIHGDEPASSWALLHWAEKNLKLFENVSVILYPCLNPWGMVNNIRSNQSGKDLNRIWDGPNSELTKAILPRLQGLSFDLSINLHEDYDAHGIYLYEPYMGGRNDLIASKILGAGEKFLPVDSRKRIEGRICKQGIIRPRLSSLPEDGSPEAIYLVKNHGRRHFTLETPSEENFGQRVKAQRRMIESAIQQIIS